MKSLFKGKKFFKISKEEISGFENTDYINENEILILDSDINVLKKYKGKNTVIDENLKALKSSIKGILDFKNSKINVIPLEIIEDSIDYLTGKKIFNGNLWVKGDVLSGVELKIYGNLQVDGVVENVRIKCSGDIIIKGGFLGQEEGMILCNGNFYAGYVQSGSIKANEVIIGDNISNSNIVALKSLVVNGKGKIIGGNYFVKDFVISREIGSPRIIETNIKIGYDFIKKRELQILKNRLIKLKMKIEDNKNLFKKYFDNVEYNCYEIDLIMKNISNNEKKSLLIKLLENIEFKEKFHDLKMAIKKFNFEKIANLEAYLKADLIHPGVNLFILDKTLIVKETLKGKNLIFKRDNMEKWLQS